MTISPESMPNQAPTNDPSAAAGLPEPFRSLLDAGDWEGAKAAAAAALARNDADIMAWELSAFLSAQAGERDKAIAAFRRLTELQPDRAVIWYNLGVALQDAGNGPEAAVAYQKALAIQPDYAQAMTNSGLLARDQGDREKAEELFRKALAVAPDLPEANQALGAFLLDQGGSEEAEPLFRKVLAAIPTHPDAIAGLGRCAEARGDRTEANAAYMTALEIEPAHAESHWRLGWLRLGHGRINESINHFRHVLALAPQSAEAVYALGQALAQSNGRNDLDEAYACLSRVAEAVPERIDVRFALAQLQVRRGEKSDALQRFSEIAAEAPEFTAAQAEMRRLQPTAEALPALQAQLQGVLAGERELSNADLPLLFALSEVIVAAGIKGDAQSIARRIGPLVEYGNPPELRRESHFALAELAFLAGNSQVALDNLIAANALLYEDAVDPGPLFERTAVVFSPASVATWPKASKGLGREWVFLVAFPGAAIEPLRSAMVDVARMKWGGEFVIAQELIARLPELIGSIQPFPDCMAALSAEAVEQLAEQAVRMMGLTGAEEGKPVVFTLTDHFAAIGLLAQMFPTAKFVFAGGRPESDCWRLFATPQSWRYRYVRTLTALGGYHTRLRPLLRHWRSLLGPRAVWFNLDAVTEAAFAELAGALPQETSAIALADCYHANRSIRESGTADVKHFTEWLAELRHALAA